MMRILFLANNWVGWQAVRWLREQNEQLVGLVIHPLEKQKYADEIITSAQMKQEHIFDGSKLRQRDVLNAIKALQPDIGVSVFFDYILKREFFGMFSAGVVNLHPSFLPYNRGQFPNVWSIVEGTPSGVTLHYIDEGIDTGDIIAQKEVPLTWTDTGESLYRRLERASVELFKDVWPLIREGNALRQPQIGLKGTYHTTNDVDRIDKIDLEARYKARDLINIIRSRTFPPYRGAYFMNGGRRIYLRLELLDERELEDSW
jgi:methionyl-tRNA formyltransferase